MSHLFYDFDTLKEGTEHMTDVLKKCYQNMSSRMVSPPV
jgi:hypothetical protein